MIMRSIIEWCDNKLEEAIDEVDERKGMRKAAASGAVEGFCDAAIVMYVPVVIACWIYQSKLNKK
jgi:hypothetical protein